MLRVIAQGKSSLLMVGCRRGEPTFAMHSHKLIEPDRQKVVVTGASGFIGRHVVEALHTRGHEVIAVSRTSGHGILRQESYDELPEGDAVIHLAESNNRNATGREGEEAASKSLQTLERILRKPFRKVLYASSAAVYGDQFSGARVETDSVFPSSIYAELKLASEAAVLGRQNGGGIVCRLTNVIGPGMSEANVLSKILSQLGSTEPVEVFALSPIRDFIWVADAAKAIVALIEGERTGVFNIGTGIPTSIGELAEMAINAAGQAGREIREVNGSMLQGNVGAKIGSNLVLDIQKIREEVGWMPKQDLAKSIEILVREYLARKTAL